MLIESLHVVLSPAPGQRLLEIGAGSGRYALELAGAIAPGGTIAIVDDQPRMLETAMRRAHERGLENLSAGPATLRTLAARCGLRIAGRTLVDSGDLTELDAGERSARLH